MQPHHTSAGGDFYPSRAEANPKVTSFAATISALCYSIIQERCPRLDDETFDHNKVVTFVLGQFGRMPDYLRLALTVLALTLDCETRMRTASRFHRLDHAARWRQLERWRHSRVGLRRDFLRFFESLVIFGWYSAAYERPQRSSG